MVLFSTEVSAQFFISYAMPNRIEYVINLYGYCTSTHIYTYLLLISKVLYEPQIV